MKRFLSLDWDAVAGIAAAVAALVLHFLHIALTETLLILMLLLLALLLLRDLRHVIGFVGSMLCLPAIRAISRLTVEQARLRPWAMTHIEQPLAIPREISSRSARVSELGERRRMGGAIPP